MTKLTTQDIDSHEDELLLLALEHGVLDRDDVVHVIETELIERFVNTFDPE